MVLFRENDTIAGKYRAGRLLGEGGMGTVIAAHHLELDQAVAIKFLRSDIAEQSASAERFRREARAAAKIRSEHVCRVIDVGTLDTGIPYMVMEYLEGHDLGRELSDRRRLPVSEASDYILQACEAVAEAHAAGIVHRDLKPENLFLATKPDGTRAVKVLDFGVSKSLLGGSSQLKLTKTASIVGSPLYMSPEQLDALKDVDGRADVWGLGVILYELVAGQTPFLAETVPQLVQAVMQGVPAPFDTFGVTVPGGFEAAVGRALEKQRAKRYASIAEFAQAISSFAPAHAAVSVTRTARLLAKMHSNPGSVIPATTPDVDAVLRIEAIEGTPTLDVVGQKAVRPIPDGTPPASWGATRGDGKSRRFGLVLALAAVPFVALVALVLFRSRDGGSSEKGSEHAPTSAPAQPGAKGATPFAQPAAAVPSIRSDPTALAVSSTGEPPAPEAAPNPATSRSAAPAAATLPSATALRARRQTEPPLSKSARPLGEALPKPTGSAEGLPNFGGRR